jgi:predicted dehydrogenase
MLRIGVIGLGYWGPLIARNVLAAPDAELAVLCDIDPARLERLAALYPGARLTQSAADVFEDGSVEAVAIATPALTHYSLARKGLQSGKDVLVEKPLAASAKQAEDLVTLAERERRVLMVDHVFLFSPAVQKLAGLLRDDEFGDIHFIDSVRVNLGIVQRDVSVVWDLAPHDLSIIDYLVGRPARGLVAVGSSPGAIGMPTVAYLHVDYGDDLLASVHVSWLSPVKIRHFLLGGSRKSALYNDLDPSEPVKIYDRGVDVTTDPERRREILVSYRTGAVVSPKVDKIEPLCNVVAHFCACIASRQRPLTDGRHGLRVVRLLEAADLSLARDSRYVEVEAA